MQGTIQTYRGLNEEQKYQAVEIFIDGFGHLMKFSKDRNVLRTLIFHALNPDYTYAFVENQTVLGMLALATNKVRPVKLEKEICSELFGRMKGNIICSEMNAIFQSKVVDQDTDLYIDVLATAKESRGKGVGTKLLEYSFHLPEYQTYYIEVLSKNENALRLYKKVGFVECKKSRFSPIAFQGYGYPIKMVKTLR